MPPESPGAGAPAIRCSPEMIAAGADLIQRHFSDVISYASSVEALASEFYQAMERRRCLSLSGPSEQNG